MYENKIPFEIQDYYEKLQQVFFSIFEDLIRVRFFLTWQWLPLYIIIIIHILYVIVIETIKKRTIPIHDFIQSFRESLCIKF